MTLSAKGAARAARRAQGVRWAVLALALAASGVFLMRAAAQAHHDPLTNEESDQVREASADPEKRLKLFVDFARQRLVDFDAARKANAPDRGQKLYQVLEEYQDIIKELDDNLDEYMSGHVTGEMSTKPKLRKPIEAASAAEQNFLASLKAIEQTSSQSDLQSYHLQLEDCISATQDSMKTAQSDLDELGKREQKEKADKELEKKRRKEEKEEEKRERQREREDRGAALGRRPPASVFEPPAL